MQLSLFADVEYYLIIIQDLQMVMSSNLGYHLHDSTQHEYFIKFHINKQRFFLFASSGLLKSLSTPKIMPCQDQSFLLRWN
jgi:hypothetical protein